MIALIDLSPSWRIDEPTLAINSRLLCTALIIAPAMDEATAFLRPSPAWTGFTLVTRSLEGVA
jgi:hypothetical protein